MSDDFMGGTSLPAYKFEQVGDTAVGIVDKIDKLHDRDPSGTPKNWPDGNPVWVYVFELRDPTTGEAQALWVRSNMVSAIREAVTAAGFKTPVGLLLKVRFDGLGTPKQKGYNPPKLYKVKAEPAPANAAPRKTATVTDEEPW